VTTLKQASHSLQRSGQQRARLARESQRYLEEYVRQARADGASWQLIGTALGITRQSAWERFAHLPAGAAQAARAPQPRAPSAQQTAQKMERYIQQARAAGASWQVIGTALGITRQSAWQRFRLLPGPVRRPARRTTVPWSRKETERYVRQARAAGASWQVIGTALGISRQSAWERFAHLRVRPVSPRREPTRPHVWPTTEPIPEAVLRSRHLSLNAFKIWVSRAARTDSAIRRWLMTPNSDLGHFIARGAVQPQDWVGYNALRDFLMVAGHTADGGPGSAVKDHNERADQPGKAGPRRVACPACGRLYMTEEFLERHQRRDHRESPSP
jgi:biotin operon repressor